MDSSIGTQRGWVLLREPTQTWQDSGPTGDLYINGPQQQYPRLLRRGVVEGISMAYEVPIHSTLVPCPIFSIDCYYPKWSPRTGVD